MPKHDLSTRYGFISWFLTRWAVPSGLFLATFIMRIFTASPAAFKIEHVFGVSKPRPEAAPPEKQQRPSYRLPASHCLSHHI